MNKPKSQFANHKDKNVSPIPCNGAVWASVMDRRYGLEVVRLEPYKGELRIYDLDQPKEGLLHSVRVCITFDACYGVSDADQNYWEEYSIDLIDKEL